MKVLIASPEAVPYAKTGGLADVVGALSREFLKSRGGPSVRLFMPYYKTLKANPKNLNLSFDIKIGGGGPSYKGGLYSEGHAVFIRCDKLFGRDELYGTPSGDYPDNARRFIFFSKAVLEGAKLLGFRPDVVHVHDWQAALIPFFLKTLYSGDKFFKAVRSVLTIHNLGYQGLFPPEVMPEAGLGWEFFTPDTLEFYGKVNFLKAGIVAADALTTVSPTYAREILAPEQGFGLDGLLRKRASALSGILNGIDYGLWDPAKDPRLPANFSDGKDFIKGKGACKEALAARCGFKDPGAPVISFIGRLSAQKGVELFIEAASDPVLRGVNIAVLGKGDDYYQRALAALAEKRAGAFFLSFAFDEDLSHLMYAGSDMFLMPSRYEPCGLGQLISQKYGTPPVARKTGGLADTITDFEPLGESGTGFLFGDFSTSSLRECLRGALCAYAGKTRWRALARRGMAMDFSWANSARKYLELYRGVVRGEGR